MKKSRADCAPADNAYVFTRKGNIYPKFYKALSAVCE